MPRTAKVLFEKKYHSPLRSRCRVQILDSFLQTPEAVTNENAKDMAKKEVLSVQLHELLAWLWV